MAAATHAQAAAPDSFVLHNDHLVVTFAKSDAGPRLASVEHRATGDVYRFERSEEVALAIVPPERVGDPKCRPRYRFQNGFKFERADVDGSGTRATLHFRHALLSADVSYELESHAAVLRKTVACTAGKGGAYVAGVTLWLAKLSDAQHAWPKRDATGQPAVLLQDRSGCFLTLEWPMAHFASLKGDVRLGYRPGYAIAAGESREVGAGAIGFFEQRAGQQGLEAGRRAFFAHVADRVQPAIPFPVKFTTWGPWLGQTREDRILEVMDDLQYVGVDLMHFDAGWQRADHPYSRHLPRARGADDETWDREMTQPDRVPKGLLPIVAAAKERGMKVSLWFDACGNVFVREGEQWAIRDKEGKPVIGRMWEQRWPQAPRQSLASEYGDRLREFVLEAMDRYDLGGIMFDNNHYTPEFGGDRRSLANGWNARDVQLRQILEILDEGERRRPGIYRFYCLGASLPWALKHATHIHAGDPGTSGKMREAIATDYPARALAFERHLAWQRHYDNFVPPWGVKGDVAGWSVQQGSPIPVNVEHTGLLIPAGEGWTQNMFTCFATTAVRDVRFSFRQMPAYDREVLKEWLAWDRQRTRFVLNCRPLFRPSGEPNAGINGYSHVADGKGVIYLFNNSFDLAEAEVKLDETAGFEPGDRGLSAAIVFPMKAPLGSGKVSYGDTLRVPIIAKDCVVIEIGLAATKKLKPYAEYEKTARSVRRSFDTVFLTRPEVIVRATRKGSLRVEVGEGPRDRRLAAQVVETLAAAAGRAMTLDDCVATPAADAACQLIIGTHDGLSKHADVGARFREVLYSRFVEWDGSLVSAPLAAELPDAKPPTFCLIAPRPEQLARLAINLVSAVEENAKTLAEAKMPKHPKPALAFATDVPAGCTALRFRPVMRAGGHVPIPGDVAMLRYQIDVERGGKRKTLWSEHIPPFYTMGDRPWWKDRLVSVAGLAGEKVTFHLTVKAFRGEIHPRFTVGFDRVALLGLPVGR